ncbi:MAG: hypothetical protein ACREFJ_10935 [Acetobacteraceae bacterium]
MRKTFLAGGRVPAKVARLLWVPIAALALLAGCANSAGTGPTLGQAQSEASAILAALQAGSAIYAGATTTTPAEAAAVENVMQIAKTAVQAFGGVQDGTAGQLAEEVSTALESVLAVLPIDPATKTAIDAGMAVIDGLVATFAATPNLAVAEHAPVAAVAPPVPIPAPHLLPPTV